MGDPLRRWWDFDDLEATEERLRRLLDADPSLAGRAEILTQLARVEGLRGCFDAGHALVDEAEQLAPSSRIVQARVLIERGRLHRSRGDAGTAFPLFDEAFAVALAAGEVWLAVDAAHMAALAAPDHAAMVAWTERGIGLARSSGDPEIEYWLGPLLNNIGWRYYATGDYDAALGAFAEALAVRERDSANPQAREIARYALAKTLRALGRTDEAVTLGEAAVAWAEGAGEPDGWFHEELAESYAATGRQREAAEHAARALPLLLRDDPSFSEDAGRRDRLRSLAGEASGG